MRGWIWRVSVWMAAIGCVFAVGAEVQTPKPAPLLSPVFVFDEGTAANAKAAWLARREELKQQWLEVLGKFPRQKPPLNTSVIGTEKLPGFTRQHIRYQVEENLFTDGYLLTPENARGKLPVVVVFHPTTPFGARGVAGLEPAYPVEKRQGIQLVRRGYLVWCPRNFINADGADYAGNAAKVLAAHPGWTGMGRMTWDAIRAADFVESWPGADTNRIACLGHSLGAKEVLYATAFDDRYRAGIFSEGGIGLTFSNWDAPWYLGKQIKDPGFKCEHHELIAMIAPRPFLLIAGDSADDDRSRLFLEAARPIYRLFGSGENLRWLNHREGHVYDAEVATKVEEFMGRWANN